MTKRGEKNLYGLLSTLTGIGEQYYRNKYAQDLAQQQAQAKFDEEQLKRQTEREDWLWKLGVQQDIKTQEETQKDAKKQYQTGLDQQIANMLIGGTVEAPPPEFENVTNTPVRLRPGMREDLTGEITPQGQGVINPQRPIVGGEVTEVPIPFQQSYGLLTQIQDPQTQSIARKMLEDRFKAKEQTQIVPANKVPGYEKYGKDYIVPVKVTTNPATGEVSYEPTGTKPYRLPTHTPSRYDSFQPANKYIKEAPDGMFVKVTTETNEYGETTTSKTQPFAMTTTDDLGRTVLSPEAKDYVKTASKMNIPMRTYLKGIPNQVGNIEMYDENGKGILRPVNRDNISEEDIDVARINSWSPEEVKHYWEQRKGAIVENLKNSISPEAVWVYRDAWDESQKVKGNSELKRAEFQDKSIKKLYEYMKDPNATKASVELLSKLIQTDFLLSPEELATYLSEEGLAE